MSNNAGLYKAVENILETEVNNKNRSIVADIVTQIKNIFGILKTYGVMMSGDDVTAIDKSQMRGYITARLAAEIRYLDDIVVNLGYNKLSEGYSDMDFAAALLRECKMYSDLYEKNFSVSLANGYKFLLNNHISKSRYLFRLADEAVEAIDEAIAAGNISSKKFYLRAEPIKDLGTREFRIRKTMHVKAEKECRDENVFLYATKKTGSKVYRVSVPVTIVNGRYYILEDEYKTLTSKYTPIARFDFTPFRSMKGKHKFEARDEMNTKSEMKTVYNYKASFNVRNRHAAIKRAIEEKNKIYVTEYLTFLVNISGNPHSRSHAYHEIYKADLEYATYLAMELGTAKKTAGDFDAMDRAITAGK